MEFNKPVVRGNHSLTRESFPQIMLSICTEKYNTKGARHGVLIIYGSGYCSALSSALHLSNEISVPIIIPCTNTFDVNRYLIFTRRMVHVAE